MTEELKEQIHERVYNIKVPTLGFSRRDLFNIAMEYAEPREKRIAELEKENAELKGIKDVATLIRANNDTVVTLMQLNNKLVSKSQQLTKAKVFIRSLKSLIEDVCDINYLSKDNTRLLVEAEQFIKDSEVKK